MLLFIYVYICIYLLHIIVFLYGGEVFGLGESFSFLLGFVLGREVFPSAVETGVPMLVGGKELLIDVLD